MTSISCNISIVPIFCRIDSEIQEQESHRHHHSHHGHDAAVSSVSIVSEETLDLDEVI